MDEIMKEGQQKLSRFDWAFLIKKLWPFLFLYSQESYSIQNISRNCSDFLKAAGLFVILTVQVASSNVN